MLRSRPVGATSRLCLGVARLRRGEVRSPYDVSVAEAGLLQKRVGVRKLMDAKANMGQLI
jgi:hypothetical protein